MSGCYRCGLAEGSEARLCETCYQNAFHCSPVSCQEDPEPTPVVELSAGCQRALLACGAVAYLAVVGVGMSTRQAVLAEQNLRAARSAYITTGAQSPVKHYHYYDSLTFVSDDSIG
jgi:hypothetical protein